jgi:hypothetical protein
VNAGWVSRIETLIRQLQGMLGGKMIRVGTDVLVFTAAATSATLTVNHGLGRTPICVLALCEVNADYIVMGAIAGSRNATSFQVAGRTNAAGVLTANVRFFWLAAG